MTGRPTLFVASTGGHLAQMVQLAPRIEPDRDLRVWATFDTPQSRSLLTDERVEFVDFMAPRQWRRGVSNLPKAINIFRKYRPGRVFSTGSGIALSFLPIALPLGVHASYIESAARTEGPSLTGTLLSYTPGVRTFTQYKNYASKRWQFGFSVFDTYSRWDGGHRAVVETPKILVLLGTLDFPFTRLVEQVETSLPKRADVIWQLGHTRPPTDLPGRYFAFAPASDLASMAKSATAIVAHAGCGSALTSLDAGVSPLLVPRHRAHGEHVDDHQVQVARELADRGIATYVEVEDLTERMLATSHRLPADAIDSRTS